MQSSQSGHAQFKCVNTLFDIPRVLARLKSHCLIVTGGCEVYTAVVLPGKISTGVVAVLEKPP